MRCRAAVVALCLTLFCAAPASAQYYFTKRGAERAARSFVPTKYGVSGHIATVCRPQGLNAADPRYVYHRWVCGWASNDGCDGQARIVGSKVRWYSGVDVYGSCGSPSPAAPSSPPASPPTTGNFGTGNGTVVQCQDGTLSDSGGIQGACSHHGGVGP